MTMASGRAAKTIQVKRRYAGDEADRVAALEAPANGIVALKPDVTSPAVDAIRRESGTIPIVLTDSFLFHDNL